MKWVRFSERWPVTSGYPIMSPYQQTIGEAVHEEPTEIVVRSSDFNGDRRAFYNPYASAWRFSDCTHPAQNCAFSTENAEWLED